VHVVIAGSSGLIGTALTQHLIDGGHKVTRLVRREARTSQESSWDPSAGVIDRDVIASADVVINLAGASIGDHRLTDRYAKVVLDSRLVTTRLIAQTLGATRTGHLIQASAMGYYGPRGDEPITERSAPGWGVLANISAQWEEAALAAVEAGTQVQFLRTGLVLASEGGLAARLLPLVRRGLLRRLGPGDNWLSWISLDDAVRAIAFLATRDSMGPVNIVAPSPCRSSELVAALGKAAGRRGLFPVPAYVLRLVVGPAAEDLLGSQVGVPAVLTSMGFSWTHPTIETAASWVLGNDPRQ
jgi:uncharacterized protein (TIGR01777 family)